MRKGYDGGVGCMERAIASVPRRLGALKTLVTMRDAKSRALGILRSHVDGVKTDNLSVTPPHLPLLLRESLPWQPPNAMPALKNLRSKMPSMATCISLLYR